MRVRSKVVNTVKAVAAVLFVLLFTLCMLLPFYMIFTGKVNLRTGLDYEMSVQEDLIQGDIKWERK